MQAHDRRYWDERRETLAPTTRNAQSLDRLKVQLRNAWDIPFYRRHWQKHGFSPGQVSTWSDFTEACPVVTKADLVADQAENPPFGSYLGIAPHDVARVHGSSGTSGTPTMYGVSTRDWERAGDVFAQSQWMMGVRPTDLVQFAFPFSLFFGGWGVLYGAEKLGASCFPIGLSDTRNHVEMLFRLGSTVIEATPSYLLHMAEVAAEMGYDPAESGLRLAVVGAEPGGAIPATRERIKALWGLSIVCDSGSTSEMFPFCTNSECTEMAGPHLLNDEVWTEVVAVDDAHRRLDMGEVGSVVYTHLWRESQPMIRFQPGDRTWMSDEPCSCGRTYPRLPQGILGRADDTLVIRGLNVYPSAIESVLREIPGLGVEFRIRVRTSGTMDEIRVEAELDKNSATSTSDEARVSELEAHAADLLKQRCHLRIPVKVVPFDTFERTVLKARRVIDEREEFQ